MPQAKPYQVKRIRDRIIKMRDDGKTDFESIVEYVIAELEPFCTFKELRRKGARDIPIPPEWRKLFDKVVDLAVESSGIPRYMILSSERDQATAKVRHAAIYTLTNRLPLATREQIGQLFDRDHSSVIHALRMVPQCTERLALVGMIEGGL